jgi:hypothetical protein
MTGPDDAAIAAELRRIAYAEQPEPIGEHA